MVNIDIDGIRIRSFIRPFFKRSMGFNTQFLRNLLRKYALGSDSKVASSFIIEILSFRDLFYWYLFVVLHTQFT